MPIMTYSSSLAALCNLPTTGDLIESARMFRALPTLPVFWQEDGGFKNGIVTRNTCGVVVVMADDGRVLMPGAHEFHSPASRSHPLRRALIEVTSS